MKSTFSAIVLVLLLLAGATLWGSVAPAAAAPDLPPRPTLTPTPDLSPQPTLTPMPENLARIVLAATAYEQGWTVVQWQGGDGAWHDVNEWREQVAAGQVRWRVAPKDFNTGPFRWLVYDDDTGEVLGVSPPFTLPSSPSHWVTVEVSPALGE